MSKLVRAHQMILILWETIKTFGTEPFITEDWKKFDAYIAQKYEESGKNQLLRYLLYGLRDYYEEIYKESKK